MRILLVTNEPWGTYHAEPLVEAACQYGIELVQWCPDYKQVPAWTRVMVTVNPDELESADLVVVNGLGSEHTRAAARIAAAAQVPLGFAELAYLYPHPPPSIYQWSVLTAISECSAQVLSVCSGAQPEGIQIVGWPGLDHLPTYRPYPNRLLALTSVSASMITGGASAPANQLLYDILDALDPDVWSITVRPHPCEPHTGWSRWDIDDEPTPATALAGSSVAIGPVGTSTLYAAALGIPWIGIDHPGIPEYLKAASTLVASVGEGVLALTSATAVKPSKVQAITGPVGDAAQRIVQAWTTAVEA